MAVPQSAQDADPPSESGWPLHGFVPGVQEGKVTPEQCQNPSLHMTHCWRPASSRGLSHALEPGAGSDEPAVVQALALAMRTMVRAGGRMGRA